MTNQTDMISLSNEMSIACNLNAISPEVRPAHEALAEQMFHSVTEREELPDGYAFHWPLSLDALQRAAAYIANERLCCPFFRFEMIVEPGKETFALRLTGRSGVKEFIDAELKLDA